MGLNEIVDTSCDLNEETNTNLAIQIINHPLSCKLLDTGHKNTTKVSPKRK